MWTLDEFAEHVKSIRRSGSHALESSTGEANARLTQSYYAFGPGTVRVNQHSCQTGNSSPTTSGFTQILLSSRGEDVLKSTSHLAPAIVEWLEGLNSLPGDQPYKC